MKKILMCIFLIGIFAFGCSPPPDKVNPQNSAAELSRNTEFVQVADHHVQADVIYAVDNNALPDQNTPIPIKWVDENLWTTVSGVVLLVYEFLALKLPTSRSVSIIGNLYKLLTWFVPDNSKKGGTFDIRDKL